MLDQITLKMKTGNLKDAAENLHQYALSLNLDQEILTEIVVLNSNINDLLKQEKRRKIKPQEALDIKTRYAFEMEDIISELRNTPDNNSGNNSNEAPKTLTPENSPISGSPNNQNPINNNINVTVNVSIENIITTEIKQNLSELQSGVALLKKDLASDENENTGEVQAAIDEVENLSKDLEKLKSAEKKEDLPPTLKKVESFLKRVEDGNDYVAKAFKLTKQGVNTLQKIGENYNAIAQWVGMPQIPGFFLNKN